MEPLLPCLSLPESGKDWDSLSFVGLRRPTRVGVHAWIPDSDLKQSINICTCYNKEGFVDGTKGKMMPSLGRLKESSSCRWRPDLLVGYGVRFEVQCCSLATILVGTDLSVF